MKAQDSIAKPAYISCYNEQHEDESLNLVCVQRACKNSGLICSLCRQSHQGHRIIPLKHVLANLKSKANSPLESDEYCDKLEDLQNLKQAMLYELKCCVEEVAEQFRQLEQDIIDTYSRIKVEIFQQIQLSMQINDLLISALHGPADKQDYLSNFHKLSKWANEKEKELTFSLDIEEFILPYHQKQKHLVDQLGNISKFVYKELHEFKSKNFIQIIQQTAQKNNKFKYRFSSALKGLSIVLNEQNSVATQSSTTSSRFAIIEQGMGLKQRTIVFKVKKLMNWIGVGTCLRDKIISVNYAFKYESLGHGSYLLSNNGYTWSHSTAEDNIHPCLFSFKQDSIVEVNLTPSEIIFKLRENNTSLKLKINYKQEEWPNVCFCANLCSENDSIEILDE